MWNSGIYSLRERKNLTEGKGSSTKGDECIYISKTRTCEFPVLVSLSFRHGGHMLFCYTAGAYLELSTTVAVLILLT